MNGSLKRQICALVFCLLLVRIYPASADLIINEIMYDPSIVSDTSGEWFEVFNSGAALDLQGYFIDDGGASKIITAPLAIGSGGYLVFGRNNDLSSNGGVPVDYTVSFSLGNSGDTLSILDPKGVPINSVTYGPGTGFPSDTGASICFTGIGDNHDGANWISARDIGITYGVGNYGTPGAPNMAAVPEPSSVVLFGSGLIVWLAARRRR